ncbi:alpha/beta hydrolase [Xanthomonas vesicatoria]|uniref:Alpha/beta hydrolase n=1 Tax=Xanthomonas vesicatoria TaxID=56460 RepID=A0AAJ0N5U3_9XANT|nr:alpha/beta hydrolase [Xanthomonas vesicatoria]APO93958.1 alpha/beta hydrolase [Xanthomonas vesicatoria]KHM97732.1 alpha/beta hydrolase [Xanthomonas vesicatoria]KHM98430.1 alpha/beta hydrolase [Xanthomonas vesicatoria]MCC8623166.1 alpha/beta hydrolase [Xanthomonas vesicatoria]MCC8694985.1 alpha/beta hydrolase [Xanthomonas vesicatoria]
MAKPMLFFLHALGGSRHAWSRVVAQFDDRFDCVALDIPGFGDAAPLEHVGTAALVDWFSAEVVARQPACWFAIGHSMGGKIATLTAARARDGVAGLAGLAGVVLVAASPPAPEPMKESRRRTMLAWFQTGQPTRAEAGQFVDANCASVLPDDCRNAAINDVLRTAPSAWNAWLTRGSREDCTTQVGRIGVPAMIVAGRQDGDLGEAAQRRFNAPPYAQAQLAIVTDAAHLIPYEQSQELARLIAAHVDRCREHCLPEDFIALLNSERVAPRMRMTLLARHVGPPAVGEGVLSRRQLDVLAAVVARVLDGAGDAQQIARRIDLALAEGTGDGWRHADLPEDHLALPLGLDALDALAGGFAEQSADRQDRWLQDIAHARVGNTSAHGLDATQLAHWFEDVRADAVRTWTSLPATMAALGYDGFAVGNDAGTGRLGYAETAADRHEHWQLRAPGAVR